MSQEADAERSSAPEGRPAELPRVEWPVGCLGGMLVNAVVLLVVAAIGTFVGHLTLKSPTTAIVVLSVAVGVLMVCGVGVAVFFARSR